MQFLSSLTLILLHINIKVDSWWGVARKKIDKGINSGIDLTPAVVACCLCSSLAGILGLCV